MITRRKFFSNAALVAGTAALASATRAAQAAENLQEPLQSSERIKGYDQADNQDYPPGEPARITALSSHLTDRRSLIKSSVASKCSI